LRIDDLDRPRVVPGATDDILRTLERLGFQWDGEPLRQSRRDEAYRHALEKLESLGLIYPCGCSRAEIAGIATAPHHGSDEVVYPGICRNGLAPGRTPRSLRIRVADDEVCFEDGILGQHCQNLPAVCGDFVVRRADGLFAYHLATVVDDAETGVNQVVRGADLLFSTPRQIYLQRVLGYGQPAYCHLPLVTAAGRGKLSKRDSAVSLAAGLDLQKDGGRLLIGGLRFLGQPAADLEPSAAPEAILQHAVQNFSPAGVPAANAEFHLPEEM
jgi:glutamyl-Q tRNA(Asp) synthetase